MEAKLKALVLKWEQLARRKFHDAELETDPMGKRLIEHGAISNFNCARDLREALDEAFWERHNPPAGSGCAAPATFSTGSNVAAARAARVAELLLHLERSGVDEAERYEVLWLAFCAVAPADVRGALL